VSPSTLIMGTTLPPRHTGHMHRRARHAQPK
jgi:hypothetical protein